MHRKNKKLSDWGANFSVPVRKALKITSGSHPPAKSYQTSWRKKCGRFTYFLGKCYRKTRNCVGESLYGHLNQRKKRNMQMLWVTLNWDCCCCSTLRGKNVHTSGEQSFTQLTTKIMSLCLRSPCAKHPWIEGIFKQYMFMTQCSIKQK